MSLVFLTISSHRLAFFGCVTGAGLLTLWATPAMAGCNSGNMPAPALLGSAACQGNAAGDSATVVGLGAAANGGFSIAFGTSAWAPKDFTTSLGYRSGAELVGAAGAGATAIGARAGRLGTGIWSVAIGAGPDSHLSANALGGGSIAIGAGHAAAPGARASGAAAVAIGNRSVAGGDGFGSAVGYNSRADVGLAPTAVGTDSTARGTNAAAFGRFSSAIAGNTTAVGSIAEARVSGTTALGFRSIAFHSLSVALGAHSLTSGPNVVSVGNGNFNRRIVFVAPAISNTDAPNLGQVKAIATTAAIEALQNETVAKAVGDIVSNDLQRELRQMRNTIERLQQEVAELKSQNTASLSK
jgi:trimeric autotransporter adhesin